MSVNDFEAFLRQAGLRPRTIAPDGRWRRCPTNDHPKKQNGAYCLASDGGVGWCQDWAVHEKPITWRPELVYAAPPMHHAAVARRAERDRRKKARATEAARAFYRDRCEPLLGGHSYLYAHGLDMTGCRGLRLDPDGWLVVPALQGREIVSVQRISPAGDKRFWPGAPIQGASYAVERSRAPITVLCEGLATGLAIFAAAPLTRVVVAFNAGNLVRIAEHLPRQGMACVAADNDHGTAERIGRNPGVEAAREAARVLGCEVAVPEGITGTDWCDLRSERVAQRLASRAYGSRERDAAIRRAVDAEIASAVARAARLLRAKGAA